MIGNGDRSATAMSNEQYIGSVVTHLEVLGDLTNKTLEGELANQELGGFLVTSDFTEGDGSGAEAMGLLDSSGSVL